MIFYQYLVFWKKCLSDFFKHSATHIIVLLKIVIDVATSTLFLHFVNIFLAVILILTQNQYTAFQTKVKYSQKI